MHIGGKSSSFHAVFVVGPYIRQLAPYQAGAYRRHRQKADHREYERAIRH